MATKKSLPMCGIVRIEHKTDSWDMFSRKLISSIKVDILLHQYDDIFAKVAVEFVEVRVPEASLSNTRFIDMADCGKSVVDNRVEAISMLGSMYTSYAFSKCWIIIAKTLGVNKRKIVMMVSPEIAFYHFLSVIPELN